MKLSAREIEASTKDVCYEIITLLQASDFYSQARLKRDWSPDTDQREVGKALCNFALESFLLHYRNLNEFLHNMGVRDSVNAHDYAPEWTFKRKTRTMPSAKQHPQLADEAEMSLIHRRLAHISGSRSQIDAHWMIPQMLERVCGVFEDFIPAVPGPQKTKFEEAINAIQSRKTLVVETVLTVGANRTDSAQVLPSAWTLDYKITR